MQEPHDTEPPAPNSRTAGTPPAAQPPAPRASLLRRVLRRCMWLALGLLAVLALAAGGLWFWSATDESLNTLLHLVQHHMPAGSSLQLEGVSGSLRRGGHIDKLVYRLHDTANPNKPGTPGPNASSPHTSSPDTSAPAGALTITLENTDIRWSWAALRHRATQLRQLHVRTLTVTDTRAAKADATPATPLTQLVLPVGVDAPFLIDTLRIARAQGATQTLTGLQGHYHYDHARAQHQLTIRQLRYLQGDYSLHATLGGQAPMPLQWQAQARLALPATSSAAPADGASAAAAASTTTGIGTATTTAPGHTAQHTVQVALNGHGTLAGADARLHIQAQAQPVRPAAPASATASTTNHATPAATASAAASHAGDTRHAPPALLALQADIRPWQQPIIAGAQAQWQHIDLQAFWPQAPHTSLQGRLDLTPLTSTATSDADTKTAPASPAAPADPVAQALGFLGTARWQATLHASNANAGPLDQQRLPLHMASSTVQYHNGHLQLQAFNWQPGPESGHISGQGQYRAAQGWQSQWRLHQLHPAALHSAVQAAPLQGTITVRSDTQARPKPESSSKALPKPSTKKSSEKSPEKPAAQPWLAAPVALEVALQSLAVRDTRLLHFDAIHVQGLWHEQLLQLPQITVRSRGGTLQGQASYHTGTQAAQADLKLQLPGSSGLLKGQLAPDSGQGQLRLDARNLRHTSQWLRPWPGMQFLHSRTLEGAAQLHASWRGGWHNNGQNMQLQARLHAPAVTVQTPADPTTAIQLRDITLTAQGRLAQAQLQAAGHMQQGSRTLQLAVQGHGGKHGTGWRAQLQALQAQLRDTMQKQQWQAELAAAVPIALEQSSQRLQLRTGAFHIRLHGQTPAATAAATQAASVQGEPLLWLRQGNHYQIQSKGTVRGLPLAWLETLSGSAALDQALTGDMLFDGAWDVELGRQLRLKAHLARSSGDIVVLAGASGQGRVAAGTRAARIDVQSTGNQVEARLLWDSAQAGTANANLRTQLQRGATGWTLPASAPLHGQLQARLPRVGIWNMFAPPGWRLRGSFNADVAFSGTVQTPLLHGTVQMDDVGVRSIVDGIAFTGGRLRARLSGQRMDIETFSLRGSPSRTGLLGTQRIDGGSLQLAGYTQWGGGPSLPESVRMQLTGKMQQLQLFTLPDRLIVLSGDVQAGFSDLKLTLRGGLRVNRALIELPTSSAPKLGDDVFIRPSSQHPKAAQAQPAQHAASARTLATAPATSANGLGDDVIVRPRAASSAANTATAARSAASAPPAKAATAKATTTRAAAAPSSATGQAATPAGTSVRPNPAIAADIQIGIDLGNNFRVRGHGLDTYLNGQLTITGGPSIGDLPRLTGTVHTDRGSFRAYGQDLQIETGRILFTGAAANPTLDITAFRSNLDIRVGVRIYGTAQQPTVQLFSDPAMPDAERLSWLVLGRSSYSAADAALLQQAAMALLGGDSRGITGQLADALGLDNINFKGGDTLGNSSVTLGKRFSKNFYVSYEKGLDATVGTLYFFLDLCRKLKLRAQTGQNSALDLIYTVSYD